MHDQGSFGVVHLCRLKPCTRRISALNPSVPSDAQLAIKTLDMGQAVTDTEEAELMRMYQHDALLKLYGVFFAHDKVYDRTGKTHWLIINHITTKPAHLAYTKQIPHLANKVLMPLVLFLLIIEQGRNSVSDVIFI